MQKSFNKLDIKQIDIKVIFLYGIIYQLLCIEILRSYKQQ